MPVIRFIAAVLLTTVLALLNAAVTHADTYQHSYQLSDSLSSPRVNAIVEDESGYVWMGTEGGLNRIEGHNTTQFTVDAGAGGLEDNYIGQLVMLPEQQMLVGTSTSLYLFDLTSSQFTRLDRKYFPGANIKGVQKILRLASGEIMVFDRDAIHLLDLQLRRHRLLDLSPLGDNLAKLSYVFAAAESLTDIYFGLDNELYAIDKTSWKIRSMSLSEGLAGVTYGRLHKLLITEDNQLWIGTRHGLVALDLNSMQSISTGYQPGSQDALRIVDMTALDEQRLALATHDGLVIYNRHTKESVHHRAPQNQTLSAGDSQRLRTVFQDSHGILWVGSLGIHQYFPAASQLESYQKFGASWIKPSSDIIWSAHETATQLWLANHYNIEVFDLNNQTKHELVLSERRQGFELNESIFAIKPLGKQMILGGAVGLFLVDQSSLAVTNIPFRDRDQVLANVRVYDVEVESPSKVWIATEQGVFIWDPQSDEMRHLTAGMSLVTDYFKSIYIDASGRKWFATDKGLLMLKNEGDEFSSFFDHSKGRVKLTDVADIIELEPGLILVSIYNEGIFGLKDVGDDQFQVIHFSQQWQLPSNNVFVMAPLGDKLLLLGTDDGLIRVDLAAKRVEIFLQKDGLPSSSFNEAASYIEPDKVMLGTENGLLVIRQNALHHLIPSAKTRLARLGVFNENGGVRQQMGYASHYELAPGTRAVSLQFATLDLTVTGPVKIRYRLKPVNKRFVEILTSNNVMLTDLKPGRYQLEIQGMSNGQWQDDIQQVTIVLQAWWWQTLTAKIIAAILSLLLVLLLIKRKLTQLGNLRRVNRALLHSEDQLKLALWGSDNHMWSWFEQTNEMHINDLGDVTGLEEAQVFSPQSWLSRIHPQDQAEVKQRWGNFLAGRDINYHCDYRISARDDQWRWIRVTAKKALLSDEAAAIKVTGTFSDITALKAMEDERSLLAHALESANDAVLIFDDHKLIIAANEAVKHLCGHDIEALKGRPLSLLVGESDAADNSQFINSLRQSGQWKGETVIRHRDGREIAIQLSLTKINQGDSGNSNNVAVFNDITEQKRIELELRELANYDLLTKLANRSLLKDRLEQAIQQSELHQQKLALLFIDLDHFKTVNDSFGHSCGDQVLQGVATKLKALVNKGATVARFGGDEFIIVLPEILSIDNVSHLAENINSSLSAPFPITSGEAFITPSIGISIWPDDARDPQRLLKCADEAMYHAKEEGRNHFRFFSKVRSEEAQYRLQLEHDLRYAISRQQLSLYYQPQIDLRSKKIVGVEALLRWLHPQHGFISPAVFIPIAENGEQIFPLSDWVLDTAIRQGKRWIDDGLSLQVSVNISAKHFRQPSFVAQVLELLQLHGLPPGQLCIEITEGMLMTEVGSPQQVIDELKAAGIAVSIDDFGTGYSSLAYLKNFSVTELKVDRSFIQELDSKAGQAIVNSILVLGDSLNMTTVAEGIETAEQAAQLCDIGCNVAQGYYYCRPIAASQLWHFTQDWHKRHGVEQDTATQQA